MTIEVFPIDRAPVLLTRTVTMAASKVAFIQYTGGISVWTNDDA